MPYSNIAKTFICWTLYSRVEIAVANRLSKIQLTKRGWTGYMSHNVAWAVELEPVEQYFEHLSSSTWVLT